MKLKKERKDEKEAAKVHNQYSTIYSKLYLVTIALDLLKLKTISRIYKCLLISYAQLNYILKSHQLKMNITLFKKNQLGS